jgi:potassium-transporting ATPase KdpC subunit
MSLKKEIGGNASPAIRLAIISMIICGLLFPLVITGFAQALFPGQADGSIAHLGTKSVGSYLIAQNFSEPYFFQSRNSSLSASGVDPDITLQDAQAQVARISNATGISQADLNNIINQHIEGTFWIFGYPYVNVLRLNMALIADYPTVYHTLNSNL